MAKVTEASWWQETANRLIYTAVAAALPFVALVSTGEVTLVFAASSIGATVLLALVWSMAALPEHDGADVPLAKAILWRVVRTAGQTALPALAGVTLLEEIGWTELWIVVSGAVVATTLRTLLMHLPEVPDLPDIEQMRRDAQTAADNLSDDSDGERTNTISAVEVSQTPDEDDRLI